MKSKIIAVSAISAALAALSLTIGAYVEFADLFTLVVASVFVIMPIYFRSYKGCFLSFLAGGVIAFLFSGFNFISLVFPSYFAFFGIYPIIKCIFDDKRFNKIVSYVVGLVWFVAVAYGMFFYYTLVMHGIFEGLPIWVMDNILYLIAPVAALIFVIYERYILVMRVAINRYLGRIIK